ncbi:MAG: carboxymuconolactone decarboxylase family protein [Rubinisphaera brasiliensis]|uniref:carboxymuconolactone decarboxylase family protein n=1 Tax=Rubinisphaera brasiliensis TaxID=119 RepID=UPI00391C6723|nr:carboxymuconolactone decarboxylase family protein [bacterium]
MAERIDYFEVAKEPLKAMTKVEQVLHESSIEFELRELVKLRASQINGCAFCVGMHTDLLRKKSVPQEKLDFLPVWEEASCYSSRERAALAWAESVTLLAETKVPDEVYEQTLDHFSEQELVDLTWCIAAINTWNRMSVAFRREPEKSA